MCKIMYPQQTPLTGAFYERGRTFISSCVKSNQWEYEHICLWIIEQIFWNKTAFALSNMVCQTRRWAEMGVRVRKWTGDSKVSLTMLTMHQLFNQPSFSWMCTGSLVWLVYSRAQEGAQQPALPSLLRYQSICYSKLKELTPAFMCRGKSVRSMGIKRRLLLINWFLCHVSVCFLLPSTERRM